MWHMPIMFTCYWSKQIALPHLTSGDIRAQTTSTQEEESWKYSGSNYNYVGYKPRIVRLMEKNIGSSGGRRSPENTVWASGSICACSWVALGWYETVNSLFCLIQLGFLSYLTTERIPSQILLNKQQTQAVFWGFEGDSRRQKDVNISLKCQQFFKQPQSL